MSLDSVTKLKGFRLPAHIEAQEMQTGVCYKVIFTVYLQKQCQDWSTGNLVLKDLVSNGLHGGRLYTAKIIRHGDRESWGHGLY